MYSTMMTPISHRDADQRQESDARRHAEVRAGEQQARKPPERRQRDDGENQADPLPRTERGIENERSAAG